MRIAKRLFSLAALLGLLACAGATAATAASTTDQGCFFCGPKVIYTQPWFSSRSPAPTTFVHHGQTAYIAHRNHAIAYDDSVVFVYRGGSADGFDKSTIYYREGAWGVSTHGNARKFFCPGPENAPWIPAQCHQVN
jgi:hypothetical protein